MLDFSELSRDGRDLEQLTRELLSALGATPFWTGKGPDDESDLLCIESSPGLIHPFERRWLVSCKHKRNPATAVGTKDLGEIVTLCGQHKATGYLLVCSSHPSSTVVTKLQAISNNTALGIQAVCWDGVKLERLLRTPRTWAIAQQFMPKSSSEWEVYATDLPSRWIVVYKGHYLHLYNRVGSRAMPHLDAVSGIVKKIQLNTPRERHHELRIRGLYYDDKNGAYVVYVDYLYPDKGKPLIGAEELLFRFADGYVAEDGQIYNWDVLLVKWNPFSDHADHDHALYYNRHLYDMQIGQNRSRVLDHWPIKMRRNRKPPIVKLAAAIGNLQCVDRIVRTVDCTVERLHLIGNAREWRDIVEDDAHGVEHFLRAAILIEVGDRTRFIKVLERLPFTVEKHFTLSRKLVFTPAGYAREEKKLYSLKLRIHSLLARTPWDVRRHLDQYARELTGAVRRLSRGREAATSEAS